MHDLAKWDIPQVWLCLALTFFLSDVYLNMVPRHVEPHSILRSSSVPSSPPHLVSFCHFPLHNSEDSASWAGMCVRLTRSSAQICSIEKEICVSCMIGVGRWTVIGECSVPPGMTLVIIMEYQCDVMLSKLKIESAYRDGMTIHGILFLLSCCLHDCVFY